MNRGNKQQAHERSISFLTLSSKITEKHYQLPYCNKESTRVKLLHSFTQLSDKNVDLFSDMILC